MLRVENARRIREGKGFKVPWREAASPNHQDDMEDSDQQVVSKELSLSLRGRKTHIVFEARDFCLERLVLLKVLGLRFRV